MRNRTPWFLVGFLTCALVFGSPSQAATATIASLNKQVTKLQTTINSMKTRLSNVESLASSTDETVQFHSADISGLEAFQGLAESDLAGLRNSAAALKTKVDAMESTPAMVDRVLKLVEPAVYQVECNGTLGTGFGLAVNVPTDLANQGYKGAIITNYRLIQGCYAGGLTVSQNKRNLGGKVWAGDSINDVALLYTTGTVNVLMPKTVAPKRGEIVLSLGSPFGLEGSVSVGIVSQLDADTVVTDAAIDTGNNGGPLVDSNGNFVGVNAWGWIDAQGSSHAVKPGVLCRQILVCPVNSYLLAWSS